MDRGAWTAKTVKRPRQQPAHPQYANYWAPLTRKRHTMPHSAQPQHTNYWAPRTRKRHQQEHRPQRPTESSNTAQHAKGRTCDCPGPRKGTPTRRNFTQGGRAQQIGCPPGSRRRQSTSRHSRRSRPGLTSPRLTWVTKMPPSHQAAVLAHRFCFSIGGGSWHQHIKDPHGNNLQRCGQNSGAVFTSPSSHRQGTAPCPASTCLVAHRRHPPGGGLVGLGQGLTQAGIAGQRVLPCAALVPDPDCPVPRPSGLGQPPWTTPQRR